MALDIDEDVGRKITKFALIGYVFLIFLAPAQPLLCFTLMGLLAIAPILLGPNPLRILGLLAFAAAGYLFWPEFQESKKVPARNEVRQAVLRADPVKAAVASYVAANQRLPVEALADVKLPSDEKADYELQPGGTIRVQMKFAPLTGQSLRLTPVLGGSGALKVGAKSGGAATGGAQVQAPAAQALGWQCISDDIAQSYLPGGCRNSENLRKAQLKKQQ
jgi:hypothetical protein